jgi:sec-independent protein translocase protein TatA
VSKPDPSLREQASRKRKHTIMPNIGLPELLIVLVIILLLFGSAKLPQLARGLGEGIRNFKQAVKEEPESPMPPSKEE